MKTDRYLLILTGYLFLALAGPRLPAAEVTLRISTPMTPPGWALLERELLQSSAQACEKFFARYFDERGYLECVARWGGDDGPDDAIENCNDWPILHALGAPQVVQQMFKKAWSGHVRQFTEAKTVEVPFARDGMYYKEFPVMFDWQHNAEGLSVFNLQSLSDPYDRNYRRQVRRFAGFYMNEDPGAPNYDSQHKIIRSLFNGSRGPLLRKATALDWTGDPIEVENRFHLGHGERNYQEMLAHFKDYNDIVGDHPLNLLSSTLALNAYMLQHEGKYRKWLLEYIDAWLARMEKNGDVIPSNVGLDGTIGGACDGKWYGGTYGWGFSVTVPQTGEIAHRNRQHWGFIGFANAYLLTGDDRYLEAWRKQADIVNSHHKVIAGTRMYPRMHGDQGWYGFSQEPYNYNSLEIYYLSMKASDRARTPTTDWLRYLEGKNPDYPVKALRHEFAEIRDRVQGINQDQTTPDTRLADHPMKFNPARVTTLLQLMVGGLHIARRGSVLHSRLRYFDPIARRAGIPPDIASLVQKMTADSVTVSLVNTSQIQGRRLIMQAGGYGEHEFVNVKIGDETRPVNNRHIEIRLAPGCGAQLKLKMKRYSHAPTANFPWGR